MIYNLHFVLWWLALSSKVGKLLIALGTLYIAMNKNQLNTELSTYATLIKQIT